MLIHNGKIYTYLILCAAILSMSGTASAQGEKPASDTLVNKPYNLARQSFQTRLVASPVKPDGPQPEPPKDSLWRKVAFSAPLGTHVAYLAAPQKAESKLPALIWARGGHGGIGREGDWIWDDHDYLQEALKAVKEGKLILFVPSWRGDNTNPGKAELFLGEVDDALAAIDHVAAFPNVDVRRIYVAGHSTGGTVAVLTSIAAGGRLRAAFGFGGIMNMYYKTYDSTYRYAPFKQRDVREAFVRSATNFVNEVKTPTFHFAGYTGEEVACFLSENMEGRAQLFGTPFHSYCINGGDHFNYVGPLMDVIIKKILKDTGMESGISFTKRETQHIFDAAVEAGKVEANK